MNPAGAETVIEVPQLRIVDDEQWAAVKARQGEVSRPLTDLPAARVKRGSWGHPLAWLCRGSHHPTVLGRTGAGFTNQAPGIWRRPLPGCIRTEVGHGWEVVAVLD